MSISVSNISAMRAMATSSFVDTSAVNTVFVETVGDFFRFVRSSSLTPVSNYVVASSDGLGQWFRMGIPNPKFLSVGFWSVDPVSGNDEAQGWGTTMAAADLVPLKTLAELDRRMGGSNMTSAVAIHLLGDVPLSDATVLTNVRSTATAGRPRIIGKKTQIGGDYVISAYATAVPASNTGYLLSATGIGAAGNLGKLVTNAAENKWAFIQSAPTADQVRLTNPNNMDSSTLTGVYTTTFSVGETVRVWNLPVLQQWPFGQAVAYPAVDSCYIKGGFSNGTSEVDLLGITSPFVFHSIIDGVIWQGGCQGVTHGCLFSGSSSNLSAGNSAYLYGCGVRGTKLLYTSGTPLWSANIDLENAQIVLSDHCLSFFNDPSTSLSIFDVPNTITSNTAILCNAGCSLSVYSSTSRIWGSGNSSYIYKAGRGSAGAISKNNSTVVTSATHPINLAGTDYDFANIPVSDGVTGSFINDGLQ